jgi:glucose/mannose transport system permease protein
LRGSARGSGSHRSPRTVAVASLVPAAVIVGGCFYTFIAWTVVISATPSRLMPRYEFVGLENYRTILNDERFRESFGHLLLFGTVFVSLALCLGLLLAICIDRVGARRATAFQMVFLYPLSLSWLVTGVVWQWILNPGFGLERAVRELGVSRFVFDVLVRPETAIFAVAGAAIWHAAGMVMALLLVGLRNAEPDIWRASRVEGVPTARTYLHVILPMLRPYLATAVLLLSFGALRMFDLIVAMTAGGPGFATDVPAIYIYDYTFARGRLGAGTASAVVLMLTAAIVVAPYLALELRRRA